MSKTAITKDQAIQTAIQIGEENYGDLEQFEITVEEDDTHWFVNFTNPQMIEDGERQHFSVWIEKSTGTSFLFRGR
jgi:hypothetical protein